MDVYVARKKIALDPKKSIGKGGEADIYDIGGGIALKLFKGPEHPDFANSPSEQNAARERLAEHNEKLRLFPKNLPGRVISPEELALDRNGKIVGYTMRLIRDAEVLLRYTDRSFRQNIAADNDAVIKAFMDIHATVNGIHRANVTIADFNDLNVLVRGTDAHFIDADSFQFGKFLTRMFTAKFADPLLCDPNALMPVLIKAHNHDSDWYAYTLMLMESLLFVGPYGGIYRPKETSKKIPHEARPLKRITVFHPDVRYPKPATRYSVLPDDLLQHFHKVFEKDLRGRFPIGLIETIRWAKCAACGIEHARIYCPNCAHVAPSAIQEVIVVRGKVTATKLKELPA